MVVIFPNLCLWRRSLCSNLGGIDPEKLYRAPQVLTFEKRFKSGAFATRVVNETTYPVPDEQNQII